MSDAYDGATRELGGDVDVEGGFRVEGTVRGGRVESRARDDGVDGSRREGAEERERAIANAVDAAVSDAERRWRAEMEELSRTARAPTRALHSSRNRARRARG